MTNYEKMHAAMLYDPNDSDIMTEQTKCLDRLYDFNHTRPSEMDKRNALLKELKSKYGSCISQDASFREYGFGALLVIIK